MGVRVSASGESLDRTANLLDRGTSDSLTVCGWARRATHRAGQTQTLFSMENATSSPGSWMWLRFNGSGALGIDLAWTIDSQFASSPAAEDWFFWYLRIDHTADPDAFTAGWKLQGGEWVTLSAAGNGWFTTAKMSLLNNGYAEWMDGAVERVRIWSSHLTVPEIEAEYDSPDAAVITANLYLSTPLLVHTDLTDDSANGYDWTAAGTLSTDAGPEFAAPPAATRARILQATGSRFI